MPASTTVGRRFTQLIQHLGISKNAFAQSLGKTATVVQHLVDERNKPGYDLLCQVFAVYPQVSKDWLLLGQGPMLMPASAAAAAPDVAPNAVAAAVPQQTSPEAAAPVAPVAPAQPTGESPPALPVPAVAAPEPVTSPAAASILPPSAAATANPEAVLTAALHMQHLQHQLALAEQRNQHLLAQQQLMQQMLDLVQRR